jgi:hypothetical protein
MWIEVSTTRVERVGSSVKRRAECLTHPLHASGTDLISALQDARTIC